MRAKFYLFKKPGKKQIYLEEEADFFIYLNALNFLQTIILFKLSYDTK